MQVDLPACKALDCYRCPSDCLFFFSCPNLQILDWTLQEDAHVSDRTVLKLRDFLLSCPHLQNFSISISRSSAPDALIHFVFCDAWEWKVWQDIRSVLVGVRCSSGFMDRQRFVTQMIGWKKYYEKWWDVFTISEQEGFSSTVDLRASMGNE